MGLLTILKKMKQKERELRLLMLYPPGRRCLEGRNPAGQEPPTGRGARLLAGTNCPQCVRTWDLPTRSGAWGAYHQQGGGVSGFVRPEAGPRGAAQDRCPSCNGDAASSGDSYVTVLTAARAWAPRLPALTLCCPAGRPRPRVGIAGRWVP